MAKANKKARASRDFELATTGRVVHPLYREVKLRQELKRQRRRMEHHQINLARFKRSKCGYCKPKVGVMFPSFTLKPKHLPFTGGE